MDALTELAILIKGGQDPTTTNNAKSMTTGKVIASPPNTNIQLNETITLDIKEVQTKWEEAIPCLLKQKA